MANSEPVKVAVEIVDKFSDDLRELEAKLEKIDGKTLTVDLEIDDNGEISKIKKRLKELERSLEATLDIDVDDAVAKARRKALEKDMYSTLHINEKKHGGSGLAGYAATGGNAKTGPPRKLPNPLENTVQKSVVENILGFEGAADYRTYHIGDDPDAVSALNEIINDDVPAAMGKPPSHRQRWSRKMGGFGLGQEFGSAITTSGRKPPDIPAMFDIPHDIHEPWGGMGEVYDDLDRFDFKIAGERWTDSGKRRKSDFEIGLGQTIDDSLRGALGVDRRSVIGPRKPDPLSGGRRRRRGLLSRTAGAGMGLLEALPTPDIDMESISAGFGKTMKKLGKFKPNIMMVWNFLALLLPMLITLAGAAIGAAAALAGLAVAGGAIVGLGLLGYGENAAESMDLLKRKLGEVKRELFQSLKPAFKAMNPILDGWLDGLAGAANRLVGPLTRLAGFEGFLGGIGGAALNYLIGFLNTISDLRPEIEAIGSVLGNVFGNTNIMDWGINELYDNMGAFLQLGSILWSLVVIIYNVAKAISFALAPFAPLLAIVATISEILSNRFTVGLLTAAAAIGMAAAAMWGLNLAMASFSFSSLAAAIGSIPKLITMLYSLFYSASLAAAGFSTLAAAIAATGVGAVLVGAGILGYMAYKRDDAGSTPRGSGGSGGFSGYGGGMGGSTINIYGDVGNSEYQKLQDEFPAMYAEETETRENADK